MTKEEQIKHWITSANSDLESAEILLLSGKFLWSLFIGHLVIEKALKAHYVNLHNETPPKIYNLIRLSKLSNIELNEESSDFFDRLNMFHIEARYPEYKSDLEKICTKEFSEEMFKRIREKLLWLKSLLK
ncbi:MAG: hypothetical protein A2X61_02360 [Ignavibacteria bacterium GWB2_35_12]|nr:MAG: hypothetical protein A2X63_03535 [Ignavibacteria bacterium GWA2_35_8]OGU42425.1 MAG: hypothetical protein A2X61_02360 [Ignavibacteria bacterium GWB2_35_12]OGU96594.1 MAG: hypothetical protein A2220_11945 [Ignavibacteria bacterium RIFOXYA2_FULL_35_10]OGV24205.1 MAG: hypothetical protein A2475_08290 [Ignavibacteria bacterium RIFOXYC2_FULL_35_21]